VRYQLLGALLFCASTGCGDADLKSGEITQMAFTTDRKSLIVVNEFKFFAGSTREKCHGRLRRFSTTNWDREADTQEIDATDLRIDGFGSKTWILQARALNRIGGGNPFTRGPQFYKLDPETLHRDELDVFQLGPEKIRYFLPSAVAFANDGRTLAVHVKRVGAKVGWLPPVIYDITAGKKKAELESFPSNDHQPPQQGVMQTVLKFSPDSTQIVSCHPCRPYQLQCHEVESGKLLKSLPTKSPVGALSFSPDGKILAALCWDGQVLIVEPDLSKTLNTLHVEGYQVFPGEIAFVGNDRLAVVSAYRQIILYDTKDWKQARVFEGELAENNRVNCLAATRDGKYLAAGHGVSGHAPGFVRIWEVASGKIVKELQ
jgi:hypothetical protein